MKRTRVLVVVVVLAAGVLGATSGDLVRPDGSDFFRDVNHPSACAAGHTMIAGRCVARGR